MEVRTLHRIRPGYPVVLAAALVLLTPLPAEAASQPQAGSKVVSAIGGVRLVAPPPSLTCTELKAHGLVVGTSMPTPKQIRSADKRARAISAMPRRNGKALYEFPPLRWKPGPGDPRFFYRAFHRRLVCGSTYTVRYEVLVGRLGTKSNRVRNYEFTVRIEAGGT